MDTYIIFQYKPKDGRPDDITLTDALTKLTADSVVPVVGDIVTIQLASILKEFKSSKEGEFKSFLVAGRNFVYHTQNGMGGGELIRCDIYIIVTDVNEDVIGVDIKM